MGHKCLRTDLSDISELVNEHTRLVDVDVFNSGLVAGHLDRLDAMA